MLKYRDGNFSNYISMLPVPSNLVKDTIFLILCAKTVKIWVKLVKNRRNN